LNIVEVGLKKKIVEKPGVFFALKLSTSSDQLYHAFHHVIDHKKTTPATRFFQNPLQKRQQKRQKSDDSPRQNFFCKITNCPEWL
jgi:hypothetical protein